MPGAIIFDLDGTLLDTLEDLADSMNDALRALGFPTHPMDAYRTFVGDGAQMLAQRAVPPAHATDDVTVGAVYQAYLGAYGRRWALKSRPYDGVAGLLDTCVARGIQMAVFSNKADSFTQVVIRTLLPHWPWAVIRGQRADCPRKPAPDGALQVAAGMGLTPAQCWFLGDSGVDMACANAAGMRSFGALWGFRSRAELEEAQAGRLVASPDEMTRLLAD